MLSLITHRHLLYQLVRRDITARYKGSFLGIFWSFLLPLTTLAIYAVVFGLVLKPRWPGVEGPMDFTLLLFSGLLILNFFLECINRAPGLIINNANYVKKVVFPVEILIWIPIGTALFHLMLGMVAWVLLALFLHGSVPPTLLLLPIVLLPLVLMTAGITWFLSALGVYMRDISQITAVLSQVLLYLSPIIYPRDALPAPLDTLMTLNPITIPVEQMRRILNLGTLPDVMFLGGYVLVALMVLGLGHLFFQKLRDGFADVV